MECNNEYARRVLNEVIDKEPLESYQTLLEESCFGRSLIYEINGKYIVYMKDEENICIEEAQSLDRAREIAKAFTDSVCSGYED